MTEVKTSRAIYASRRPTVPAIAAGSTSGEPVIIDVVDPGALPAASSAAGEFSIDVTADPGAHYVQA